MRLLRRQVFKELFDAVIGEQHPGFKSTDSHPPPDVSVDAVSDVVINRQQCGIGQCALVVGKSAESTIC